MKKYYAFGLTIESEFELPQVPLSENEASDVLIKEADLSDEDFQSENTYTKNKTCYFVKGVAGFRITNGNLIEVSPDTEDYSHLAIFLLGSSMGAILHQRGEFPLHGSCVSDGKDAILITGDSGAGKSTLASIFLKHGWKLLTDDVCLIKDPEGEAMVQPSYPSQKVWEDSPEYDGNKDNDIHSLYQRDGKNKLGISVDKDFIGEPRKLTKVIKLVASSEPAGLKKIEGFDRVNEIIANTYRAYMIANENMDRHFQRCVTLGFRIPMFLANRCTTDTNTEAVYELITEVRKEHDVDESTKKESINTEPKIEQKRETVNSKTPGEDIRSMEGSTKLKRKENIITADLNGSAVTMDMVTGQYYDLGETGGEIWNHLKEVKTFDELIIEITKEYGISREDCEQDIENFLRKLISDGLVLIEK